MTTNFTLTPKRRISLLFIFFIGFFSLKAQPTVLTTDSLALVALYNSTNGPGWTNNTNWLTGPVNTWSGVTVSGNRVSNLSLGNRNLVGTIPPEIGDLTGLIFLSFGTNQLTGPIPPEIGTLTNLATLSVSGNQLTSIPPEIGNLTSLTNLVIGTNLMTGTIPVEIGNLINLTSLSLANNSFNGSLPSWVWSLTNLQALFLNNNQFNGSIPSEVGDLTNLTSLYMNNNQLSGTLPIQLFNLINLTQLDLGNNLLTGGIPPEIGNLINLTFLRLCCSNYSGAVPSTINNLTLLTSLDIAYNNLVDLPDVTPLSNLTALYIDNNLFSFEDIVPNVGITGVMFTPQKKIGVDSIVSLSPGANYLLTSYIPDYANNVYQWYKDNNAIGGANANNYLVNTVSSLDEGEYTIEVTNSGAPGLTLLSAKYSVVLKEEGYFSWVTNDLFVEEGLLGRTYGGIVGDYDNDGLDDLFTLNPNTQSNFYRNLGNGDFEKITDAFSSVDGGYGSAWADYNNDGQLDLFGSNLFDSASLFKNNGDGSFTALSLNDSIQSVSWADIDNDGLVDAIGNVVPAYDLYVFKNNGGDIFSKQLVADIANNGTLNTFLIDVNGDGAMDIYQTGGEKGLYFNDGTGNFTSQSSNLLVTHPMTSPWGASWGDLDNDGDQDVFVRQYTPGESFFFYNDGSGNFTAKSCLEVLGETCERGRASALGDINNDGYLDVLFNERLSGLTDLLVVYLNDQNNGYNKIANQNFLGASILRGITLFDYDNDGFLDIYSPGGGFLNLPNMLYKNNGNGNNWVKVKLEGNLSNRSAIGANVSLFAGGVLNNQQVITNGGLHAGKSLTLHFGLGANTAIDSVIINWPSGLQQKVTNLAINRQWLIKENNFEIDSLALVAFYNATGGPSWTTRTNWLAGPVTTWAGVTFTSGNVTSINLSNNNLVGEVPEEFTNLVKLNSINLSSNAITTLPDMTSLTELTTVNVSNNKLNFGSLESNASITGIDYTNQAILGDSTGVFVGVGTDPVVTVDGGGVADQYQWKLNNADIVGANQKNYTITAINRSNRGAYTCIVTNPTVPGLTLTSAVQTVLPTATLGGRLLVDATTTASSGQMTLFRVTAAAFDTVAIKPIDSDGTYAFDDLLLEDYQLMGFADTLAHVDALPTYYEDTPFWEEADTLFVNSNLPALDIVSQFKPVPPATGAGEVSGTLSEPSGGTGGRTTANKGIKDAGVSLRKINGTTLTLVAYKFTNTNGEFFFNKLDPGDYKLNIQYPGYPMDPDSFIDIKLGTGVFDKQVSVDAVVEGGKIVVKKRIITGFVETETYYTIYPNPSTDRISIKSKTGNSRGLLLRMMESTGKEIEVPIHYRAVEDAWSLDVRALPFGMYLINVTENGKSDVARVVIAR